MCNLLAFDSIPNTAKPWILVLLALATIIYAVMRPLRKKRSLSKGPNFASLSQQRSVERQMQHVLVELSDMSRQISAQLDTRAAKLEALIREADEKTTMLREMMNTAMVSTSTGRTSDSALGDRMTGTGDSSAGRQNNRPSLLGEAPRADAEDSSIDPRYAPIYTLADQGRSAIEIGQQLNRPSGEIELILALRKG